jgi:hypothetical protein
MTEIDPLALTENHARNRLMLTIRLGQAAYAHQQALRNVMEEAWAMPDDEVDSVTRLVVGLTANEDELDKFTHLAERIRTAHVSKEPILGIHARTRGAILGVPLSGLEGKVWGSNDLGPCVGNLSVVLGRILLLSPNDYSRYPDDGPVSLVHIERKDDVARRPVDIKLAPVNFNVTQDYDPIFCGLEDILGSVIAPTEGPFQTGFHNRSEIVRYISDLQRSL